MVLAIVSLRRFVTLLSDLGKNQLGLNIRKERDRFGSYFVGLKIRGENDHEPPLITGNSQVVINPSRENNNTNVINRLWTMVMNKVTDMMDKVIDESLASDGCDECPKGYRSAYDGKNKKSLDNTDTIETKIECNKKQQPKKELNVECLETPKHKPLDVKDGDSLRIVVGDKVTIDDCPGHWNWASPFTVEGIEGDWVRLDLVDELIEIIRLKKHLNSNR